jgi:hypothetical protein
MAGPLSKTEKMVFVSSDGAAGSRLTGDVATMMAQLGTISLSILQQYTAHCSFIDIGNSSHHTQL